MENVDILTEKVLPQVRRHRARLLRTGVTPEGGIMLLGTFDQWLFAVWENIEPEAYRYLGLIPSAERPLILCLPCDTPPEIGRRVASFVQRIDTMDRPIQVIHDDDSLQEVTRALLWRWRVWRWICRMVLRGEDGE